MRGTENQHSQQLARRFVAGDMLPIRLQRSKPTEDLEPRRHGITFQVQPRLRNRSMRRGSIISGLMILVLATSALGCASGWVGKAGTFCSRPSTRGTCAERKPGTTAAEGRSCGHTLKSSPGQCSLRSLAQFQLAEQRRFELASPLRQARSKASPSSNSGIVSSIGSPETDRGPPRS
jgi:hypothetical protein